MYPIQSRGQRGQGGTEYALLLASISLVIIFASGALFTVVKIQFRNTLCEMDSNGRVQYECNDGVEPGMPIADFTVTCPSLSCTINAAGSRDTNSDASGAIVSYAWDFGDSTFGTGETPPKTYAANGTYTITLVVTDDDGNTASTTRSVYAELPNNAPTATFTFSCTDLTCSFNAGASGDSDGSVVSYEWWYGDGDTGTGVTSSHPYANSGTRTVTLKVTDNGGKSTTTTRTVTPTVPAAMLAHVSDLSKTTATSGSNWTATITITVKNGNNVAMSGATVYGSFTNGGGAGKTCGPTNASGQCTITSTGVPKNGGSAVSSMVFTIDNVTGSLEYYPTANIETSITATIPTNTAPTITNMTVNCTNLVCNFSGTGTDDTAIGGYSWDFGGGGSFTGGSATSQSGIYTYSSAGTYNIKLTVADDLGETVEATTSRTVTAAGNAVPVASITSVNCNLLACTFNGSGTDSDGTVTGYSWNFGGGGSFTSGSATAQTGTYTYSAAGTYTITLTVTDNLTATGSATTSRTVAATNALPVAVMNSVNCTNLACTFNGTGNDTDGTITGYNWNFGGGGSFTVGSATAQTGTYTYSAAGTYTITLTVTDNLTATGSTTTSRTVTAPANAAPVAIINLVNCANLVCSFSGSGTDSDGTVTGYNWNFGGGGSFTSGSATAQSGTYTYSAAGSYTITLTVTDNLTATGSTTTSRTVTAAPTATSVNIADLDGANAQSGSNWTATITITVKNNLGVAVSGATVTGSFNPTSGGTGKTCVTNASGVCTIVSNAVARNGGGAVASLTFTVSNVTGSLTYNSAANTDPEADSNGTAITVAKP